MTPETHKLILVILEVFEIGAVLAGAVIVFLAYRQICALWQKTNNLLDNINCTLSDIDTGIDCLDPNKERGKY